MIRNVIRFIGISLLVAAACSDPRTEALREGSLAEAIPPEDGNAGESRSPGTFSTTVAESACQPVNGGWHHCSAACPCNPGEGDCDGNDECASGLTCVKNIGASYGWDSDVDVCEDTCHPSANGGFHYCSAACPCNPGEGDCDGNDECAPGLTCVKDIGPVYGWDADVDVCEDTCHPSANGGFHYCSAACPCADGEGDCDRNSECLPGLTCVKDVGPNYGWDSDVDVCEGQCDDTGDTCSPGCPCAPTGTSLLIQVLALDGQPIPSAAVTTGDIPQPTDGVGRILLEDLPPGRFVARVEALGFAPASVAVDLPASAHAGTEVRLRPLGTPIPFQAEAGALIEHPAARVIIPPGALVDYLGQTVTGTVEATVVPLDPSQDTPDTLPGPLQGLAAGTGAVVELESVVMAEVSLWQNGLPVQLAPGARATLELALPDTMSGQYQIGESIPAWWLDLDTGVWREEGTGTIQPSSTDPDNLVWVVEVGHFTWWNCDAPWTDKHCFTVMVQDASGNPVPDVQVGAQGVSYTGASRSSYTGGDGRACVAIMRDSTADILVGSPSAPLATQRVTGAGPAADCTGSGAACTPVTVILQPGSVVCTPGAAEPCPYGGPPGTEGVGVCQTSTNQCNSDGTAWSGCVGDVLPAPETCFSPFDEDCDGEADDGLDCGGCSIGQRIDCYSGPPPTMDVGMCRAGTQTCSFSRVFGSCTGEVLPQPETCETPGDDNCDGSSACLCGDGLTDKVGCWPLDETSGSTSVDMVHGNNGSWFGTPTPIAGARDVALLFDGVDDYVRVADDSALNFGTGDFSISFYVRTTETGLLVILDKRTEASGPVRGYHVFLWSGSIGLQMSDGALTNYETDAFVSDGQWHHIVITVDRDQPGGIKTYRDKTLVFIANPTDRWGSLTNPQPLTLGRRSDEPNPGFFRGALDEVKLFNRVLTAAEVMGL